MGRGDHSEGEAQGTWLPGAGEESEGADCAGKGAVPGAGAELGRVGHAWGLKGPELVVSAGSPDGSQ